MLTFDEKIDMYAKLLVVHGMNVQPGQNVFVHGEIAHRKLAYLVAKHAYLRGARYVGVDLQDPYLTLLRLEESEKEEFLTYVPTFLPLKYEEMIDNCSAIIRFTGSENPDMLNDVDATAINKLQMNWKQSLKKYYDEGVGQSKVHWTVAGCATGKWGQKIFPHLNEQEAEKALWEQIFTVCRADKKECLSLWKEHNEKLHARAKYLTDLKIQKLQFKGPGTDLTVELTTHALWAGGGSKSPRKVEFEPNIPTEECFTTPDYRKTEGKVRVTRPFILNGNKIQGLELEFKAGNIVNFTAEKGAETFAAYINSDKGAKRLGEVALVGIDSPIYQSGLVFEDTLFDENAACHIAIGSAYRFCLEGCEGLNGQELEAIGCNVSCTHSDMMISSNEVDVIAHTYNGQEIKLLDKGQWTV